MLRSSWQADRTHLAKDVISTNEVWTDVVGNAIVDVGALTGLDYTTIIM